MKMRQLIRVIALIVSTLNVNAISHPAYIGYSGATGSNGQCASSCHGTSGGTIQVSGFPSDYTPGQTYTITVSHSGGMAIKQFNGSCRVGTGSQNAGIIAAGFRTAVYNTTGETNGIHLSTIDQDNATFLWTAPSSGTGDVRLYVAGHQGPHNGQNSTITLVSSELLSGVGDETQDRPRDFVLDGNYPNPFNSRTVIEYGLSQLSRVTIDIYDILGNTVESLEFQQAAGTHKVIWNADDRPSGVYFYKIRTDDYAETRKMTLLR